MSTNKLINLYSSLSDTEWRSLDRTIKFRTNKSTEVYKLFSILKNQRKRWCKTWDSDLFHKTNFNRVSKKTFLNMLSILFKMTENWLLEDKLKNDVLVRDLMLIKTLNERGLSHLEKPYRKSLKINIHKLNNCNREKYQYLEEFYTEIWNVDSENDPSESASMIDLLVEAFLENTALKSYMYYLILYHQSKYWTKEENPKIEPLRKLKELIPPLANDEFILMEKLIEKEDFSIFLLLKAKMMQKHFNIDSDVNRLIVYLLLDYSMKFWNKGELKNPSIISDIFQFALESDLLLFGKGEHAKLSRGRFHNFVATIGAIIGGDWNDKFINDWYLKIDSNHPEKDKSLALAQNCFYKREYAQIIPLLRGLSFEDARSQARLLCLEMIAWFEERKISERLFLKAIARMRSFLKNGKTYLSTHAYKSYYNLSIVLEGIHNEQSNVYLEDFISKNKIIYRNYVQGLLLSMNRNN